MRQRSEARRIAFFVMHAIEFTGGTVENTFALMSALKPAWSELPEFTRQLCTTAETNRDTIARDVQDALENWRLERLQPSERALLKLASTEISFFPEIPPRVTINEYIEIAKRYANENAPRFINGVIDRLMRVKEKPDVIIQKSQNRARLGD
jgi:transcription antitermination protein NusB